MTGIRTIDRKGETSIAYKQYRARRLDDQSFASPSDSFVGVGESSGTLSRLLYEIYRMFTRQNAVRESAEVRLFYGAN